MVEIKFTDVERLILANQYEILGLLHKNDNYKRMAQTLRDGHEWLYSQFFDFLMPNLPEQKTQHVLDILDIYSSLQGSYRKLTDKSGIDESDLVFPGFDGKHETELLSFANALRKNEHFTETIGEHAKNSHYRTNDMYERMVARWRELDEPLYPYSKETILAILEARIRPSRRNQST